MTLTMTGRFGDAARNARGRVKPRAANEDARQRVLNERGVELLAVVTTRLPAFKDAYRDRVEPEVKVKAVVATADIGQMKSKQRIDLAARTY